MKGQINRGSLLGEHIYNLAKRNDVNNIVDIGTWNGLGSTKCILDAVVGTRKEVWSIECNKMLYEEANVRLLFRPDSFHLIHGSLITYTELEDEALFNGFVKGANKWLKEDLDWLVHTPCVLDQMPTYVDLAVIDGGEYSGWLEFVKLLRRTRYFVLDDTKTDKHRFTRAFVLENLHKFKVIDDNQVDRNGYMVLEHLDVER